MAAPLRRLRRSADPGVQPLVRALRTTLANRATPEERSWIERIEKRRRGLLAEDTPTGMPHFDAAALSASGGFAMTPPETTMGVASAFMSLAANWSVLLMRVVEEKAPRRALEVGTGFGVSGCYQAAAMEINGHGTLTTLDGSRAWAEYAAEGFAELGLAERVAVRVGPIAETLAEEAECKAPLDFVFIDAEHQQQPTLEHFATISPHLADGAIVAFDDAEWPDIRAAFKQISGHERVSTSIVVGRFCFAIMRGGRQRS